MGTLVVNQTRDPIPSIAVNGIRPEWPATAIPAVATSTLNLFRASGFSSSKARRLLSPVRHSREPPHSIATSPTKQPLMNLLSSNGCRNPSVPRSLLEQPQRNRATKNTNDKHTINNLLPSRPQRPALVDRNPPGSEFQPSCSLLPPCLPPSPACSNGRTQQRTKKLLQRWELDWPSGSEAEMAARSDRVRPPGPPSAPRQRPPTVPLARSVPSTFHGSEILPRFALSAFGCAGSADRIRQRRA